MPEGTEDVEAETRMEPSLPVFFTFRPSLLMDEKEK